MPRNRKDGTAGNTPRPRRNRRTRDEVFAAAEEIHRILSAFDRAGREMVFALVDARYGLSREPVIPPPPVDPDQLPLPSYSPIPLNADSIVGQDFDGPIVVSDDGDVLYGDPNSARNSLRRPEGLV